MNNNAGCADIAPEGASKRDDGQNGSTGGTHGAEGEAAKQSRPVSVVSPVIVPLPVPSGVGTAISAKRQDAIVKAMNKGGCHFRKERPTYTELGRFKVCAVDEKEKAILLTADNSDYANTRYVQDLCSEFIPYGWKVFLWTGDDQSIHLVQEREPSTRSDPHPPKTEKLSGEKWKAA